MTAKISDFIRLSEKFKPLCDPTRLWILHCVRQAGGCIQNRELLRQIGCSKAKLCNHLAVLQYAGIVGREDDNSDPRHTAIVITMIDDPAKWRLFNV